MTRAMIALLFFVFFFVASGAVTAADGELGTLFFSIAERNAMDRVRRGEPSRPALATESTISGYVKRSDGKDTVWLSGSARPMKPALSEQMHPSHVQSADRVTIHVNASQSVGNSSEHKRERSAPSIPDASH